MTRSFLNGAETETISMLNKKHLNTFISRSLKEDVGAGDYTTLACIPENVTGTAILKIKEDGILAGVDVAKSIFLYLQSDMAFRALMKDGDRMQVGDIAFEITGRAHTLLTGERLALNCMQRMSGIATLTHQYTEKLKGYHTRLLDTRKTTPGFRALEKEAVRIGGGYNHRMGLYDMILLKDNHIDFCGGIKPAIERVSEFLKEKKLNIPIEIEVRTLENIEEVLSIGKINRIMFDNFSPEMTEKAVKMIDRKFETESSGNISLDTIESYAKTGVDFISAGAIIHHAVSIDLSLKAVIS